MKEEIEILKLLNETVQKLSSRTWQLLISNIVMFILIIILFFK